MKLVIVLTFANDRDNYLPLIVRESKTIFKTLQTFHDKGYIQVHKEENTGVTDIFDLCHRYRGRIAIFHYGGHANGTLLQLETRTGEPQAAYASGLAQLLGQLEQLKLVFLNGCATLKQVDLLMEAGVPAVIATSVPINDETATEFAEHFYRALESGASLQKAFEGAKGCNHTSHITPREISLFPYRRPNLETVTQKPETFPWGLYFNENKKEVLDWKLPRANTETVYVQGAKGSTSGNATVNTGLIETLFNEMMAHGVEKPRKLDWRVLRTLVIDHFPVPVGEQLRVLFLSSTICVQRLHQLVQTYKTTMELLCFTLLSQLWDAQKENPALLMPPDHVPPFQCFFALGPDSVTTFDYGPLTAALLRIFQANRITCFMEELNTLEKNFRAEEEFSQALLFMEERKKELRESNVNAENLTRYCVEGERHLGSILKKLAFWVSYQMTTIKTIEVIKPRHKKATFNHHKVTLNRVSQGLADEAAEGESFTDNNSVIFLDNNRTVGSYLNLSPFIIDENALTGNECSKLFFYSHQEEQGGKTCYVYTFSDTRQKGLVISDINYPEIKEQMDVFKESILGLVIP